MAKEDCFASVSETTAPEAMHGGLLKSRPPGGGEQCDTPRGSMPLPPGVWNAYPGPVVSVNSTAPAQYLIYYEKMRYWVIVLSLMLSFVGGAKDLTGKVYDNCTDVSNVKCLELGKVLCKHHNPT